MSKKLFDKMMSGFLNEIGVLLHLTAVPISRQER
jgi:hypothetical protein